MSSGRRDGHDGAGGKGAAVTGPAKDVARPAPADDRAIDPRAVRVSLAASSARGDIVPMVVEPPAIPLAPVQSITGRGLLGGVAEPPPPSVAPDPDRGTAAGAGDVLVDGVTMDARLERLDPTRAVLDVDGRRWSVLLGAPAGSADGRGVVRREIVVDGWRIELELESERRASLRDRARRGREEAAHGGPTEVHAIIPGRIVSVSVSPGDAVVAGQQLLVVEAMKMQNELRAPRDGTVTRVAVAPPQTIEIGDLLLVLE